MHCRAQFLEQRLDPQSRKADYIFELTWKRPERARPPAELLVAIGSRFEIKSFESTTDNGR